MKTKFSKNWKRSKQPRKQRKYRANAPKHLKSKFMNAHLSKDLRKKYGTRSLRVRKGDKVTVTRGSFKGEKGEVQMLDVKNQKVYIDSLEVTRRDGSKSHPPVRPSNITIIELNKEDAKRMAKLGEKPVKKEKAETKEKPKEKKEQPKADKESEKSSESTKKSSGGKK